MNFEIGKTYVLDCYFSETSLNFDDRWETAYGKGSIELVPLTETAIEELNLYEEGDYEIDVYTDDFEYRGLDHCGSSIEEEPDFLEDAMIIQKRGDTELFEDF
jgi:hypothetical protein